MQKEVILCPLRKELKPPKPSSWVRHWGDKQGGARKGYSSPSGNLSPPVREKSTIRRGIFINDNKFIYCTNYEFLLVI